MISFIDDHREVYGVEPICRVLPIARRPTTCMRPDVPTREAAGSCAQRRRVDDRDPARVRGQLLRLRREEGLRQLAREGIVTARCTVARLMRRLGLAGVVRGRTVRTTIPDPAAACALDRVNRHFKAPRPNALWVSDFTYVPTWSGFVYVAFVIDVFARRIVGWRALTQRSRVLRPGCSGTRRCTSVALVRAAGGASLGPRLAILGSTLYRAPGWSRHRAVGRQRRRQLRQCLGGDDQRPVQGRGHPRRGPWRSFEAVEYATL